jgi:hypothetical protein
MPIHLQIPGVRPRPEPPAVARRQCWGTEPRDWRYLSAGKLGTIEKNGLIGKICRPLPVPLLRSAVSRKSLEAHGLAVTIWADLS